MNPALARGGPHPFLGFGMRALGLSIGLFGLLRLAWVENYLLWPFTSLQASLAAWSGGGADTYSRVGLNCSGADAIALCLAFILAWPARWGARLSAAAVGLLFIVGVNVVRIMTLVRLEPSPWFTLLHEYLWPALLTLASAGYVFGWMWWSERQSQGERRGDRGRRRRAAALDALRGGNCRLRDDLLRSGADVPRERARTGARRVDGNDGGDGRGLVRRRGHRHRTRAHDRARRLSGHRRVHRDARDPRGRGRHPHDLREPGMAVAWHC